VQYKDIILEREGNITTLILNRPEKLNTMTKLMRETEIPGALAEVHGDEDTRVLVITGAGDRAFCAGGDVGTQAARITGEIKTTTRWEITRRTGGYVCQFREIRVPTIAAVNGVAAGIGLSFALACDIRIASDKARFGCAWINRGLIPDGAATYLLPQLIGPEKALELLYTGDIISAEEALRIGLVSRVVPHGELMKVVSEMAQKLADKPPIAIELTKYGVYRGLETDIKTAIDFESYAHNVCRATEDHKEGVQSFVEKRKAVFQGR